jgi:cephalosporin hydroxylase
VAGMVFDVIVETGVAHGGSLICFTQPVDLLEKGRVIGIDMPMKNILTLFVYR